MLSKKVLIALGVLFGMSAAQTPPFMLFTAPMFAGPDIIAALGYTPITPTDTTALLRKAANLSDLASASSSRTNLGLGTGNSPQFTGLTLTSTTTGVGGNWSGVHNFNYSAGQAVVIAGNAAYPSTSGTTQTGGLRIAPAGGAPTVLDFGQGTSGNYPMWIQSVYSDNLANSAPLLINPNGGNVSIGTTSNLGYALGVSGAMIVTGLSTFGAITTGSPIGGTAGIWKTGINITAACVLSATNYVQLDVGGALYKVATCQ